MDAAVARILDANANRTAEALRVVEEFVRFDLCDGSLAACVKELRHSLAGVLAGASFQHINRVRNSTTDVGRTIKTERELERCDVGDVVTAAFRRATQALRVLEEYTKIVSPSAAREFEALRYKLYDLEHAVAVRTRGQATLCDMKLYVIVSESACALPWLRCVADAVKGGADCVQLREKTLSDAELLARAVALVDVCRGTNTRVVINDRADIARLSGADGVHVGQGDLSVADARKIVGPSRIVGVSTHTIEQARSAMTASPDYIAVGPMFPTTTKPQSHIAGPSLLARIRGETSLPLVAIGGINCDRVDEVLSAGADCLCVCSAVISQSDPMSAAEAIQAGIRSAHSVSEQSRAV